MNAKSEAIFHLIMAATWLFVIAVVIFNKEQITWRFGVIAVSYLALDELINAFFFWRRYRGKEVPGEDDESD